MTRRLAVVETPEAYLVTEAGDAEDWLVRFEKNPDFPAQGWAENMVAIFHARHLQGRPAPLAPGPRPSTYHPPEDGEGDRG